jgi:capsular polysaccharide biosynthesis protein
MAEQSVDVRRVWSQLRRHLLLLAVAVLLGAGAGAASVFVLPPVFTSESQVLLPPVPAVDGQASERDVDTEVQVATSDVVLEPAGEAVSPELTVRELAKQVTITAPTSDVLRIVARGDSAEQAEEIAAAVAASEVAYLGADAASRSSTQAAVLSERQRSLRASMATVSEQIRQTRDRRAEAGPGAPGEAADASALAALTAEQANLVLALDEVRGMIAGEQSEVEATVIQEASPARRPGLVGQLLLRGLAGAGVALLLTVVVLATVGRRDRRLRYRDEVADALGTVVLASVRSSVPKTAAGWTDLLAHHEPGTVDAWALRQVLRQLALDVAPRNRASDPAQQRVPHPASIAVISLAGDQRALAMGPQLASYAASVGVPTRLVASHGHDAASSLWAACGAEAHTKEVRPGLLVDTRNRKPRRELTVVLAVVDPQQPELTGLPRTEVTVLAVSSGAATAEELARVAVVADDTGRRISGVVLADPDDLDRTTGRLLQHERVQQVALPARLTGVEPPGGPGNVSGFRGRA